MGNILNRYGIKPTMTNKYGTRPTVIALDCDGTAFKNGWPGIGEVYIELIKELVDFRHQGGEVILWSCREDTPLTEAVYAFEDYGLRFDAVNRNTRSTLKWLYKDTRKVYADYYIDDRAVCIQAEHPEQSHIAWRDAAQDPPPKPQYDWVLVKVKLLPEGSYVVPHIAELRKDGKWYVREYDEPYEEKVSAKITHWMPIPGDE